MYIPIYVIPDYLSAVINEVLSEKGVNSRSGEAMLLSATSKNSNIAREQYEAFTSNNYLSKRVSKLTRYCMHTTYSTVGLADKTNILCSVA